MSFAAYIIRAVLYTLIAALGAASTAIMSVDFSDPKQAALFWIGVSGAGLTALRSFVDKSSSQVIPKNHENTPPAP